MAVAPGTHLSRHRQSCLDGLCLLGGITGLVLWGWLTIIPITLLSIFTGKFLFLSPWVIMAPDLCGLVERSNSRITLIWIQIQATQLALEKFLTCSEYVLISMLGKTGCVWTMLIGNLGIVRTFSRILQAMLIAFTFIYILHLFSCSPVWDNGALELACALSTGEACYWWVWEQCNTSKSLILKRWIYIKLIPEMNLSDLLREVSSPPSLAMLRRTVFHLTIPRASPEAALLFCFFTGIVTER